MLDQRALSAVPPAADVLAGAHGVSLGYGGPPVIRDLELTVHAGERIGVLGPNGAGKTTLFRALWGELTPTAGTLYRATRTGVVPQAERSRLDFPVSALDVALMGSLSTMPWWRRPGRAERERAIEALDAVGLADRAQTTFGLLSGGQRQRVTIARALVQEARLLLLDEPYSGLDRASAERLDALLSLLAGQGCALLIATHDLDQAWGWERVLSLRGGRAVFGTPDDVLRTGAAW